MKKPKHTPGPWNYEYDGDGMRFIKGPSVYVDDTYEDYRADAQLISAAPDLLKACIAALSYCHASKESPNGSIQHLAEVVAPKLDNAIKKAIKIPK